MNELKPCPFCGRKAEIRQTDKGMTSNEPHKFFRRFKIWCPTCGCTKQSEITVTFDYYATIGMRADETELQKGIEAWNRRANDA